MQIAQKGRGGDLVKGGRAAALSMMAQLPADQSLNALAKPPHAPLQPFSGANHENDMRCNRGPRRIR